MQVKDLKKGDTIIDPRTKTKCKVVFVARVYQNSYLMETGASCSLFEIDGESSVERTAE